MVCKNCNTENLDSAVFCKSCGTRIDGKIVCPTCNFANESNNVFCSKCGTRIDGKKFCNNCGSEIDGLFCTTCGQKYEEKTTKQNKQTINSDKKKRSFTILDLIGNSFLLFAVILSIIPAFTYFLIIPDWMSCYSEILESSSLGGVSLTVIITIPLIVSIYIIAIFAFISFFEKFCGKSKKHPETLSSLAVAFFLSLIFMYEYLTKHSNNYDYTCSYLPKDLILFSNGSTMLIYFIVFLYILLKIIDTTSNTPNLKFSSIAFPIISTISLIIVLCLVYSISFNITISSGIGEQETYSFSYPVISLLMSRSSDSGMFKYILMTLFIVILSIISIIMILLCLSRTINFKMNTALSITTSAIILIIIISIFAYVSMFESDFSTSNTNSITLNDSYTLPIAAFIVSLIPLTLSIINSALNKKSENIKLLNN